MSGLEDYLHTRKCYDFVDDAGHAWSFRDSLTSAPALVLLPGALGNADVAWKLVEALGDDARTLAVTYPGGVSARQLAQGLDQLLDHLGLTSVSVWGSSYGAWWAQAFAAQNPARINALWLGNGLCSAADVSGLPLFERDWLLKTAADEVVATWREATLRRPDDELSALHLRMLECGLPPTAFRARLLEVTSAIELPPATGIGNTVVFHCDDDPVIGAATRDRARRLYPEAMHWSLPTGGHYPHVTEIPALMNLMRRWLCL